MPCEEWRPVVGWEAWYEVSDHGRVRRVAPRPTHRAGKILKGSIQSTGYRTVCLSDSDREETRTVHTLVARAFLGPAEPGMQVNHKDFNKLNCFLSNLEYLTRQRNVDHAWDAGHCPVGSRHGMAKFTEAEVIAIRAAYQPGAGISLQALAQQYSCTKQAIWLIVKRKVWTHI